MKHNFQDCQKIAMYELYQMLLILNCRSFVAFKFSVSLVTRAGILYTKWQKKVPYQLLVCGMGDLS